MLPSNPINYPSYGAREYTKELRRFGEREIRIEGKLTYSFNRLHCELGAVDLIAYGLALFVYAIHSIISRTSKEKVVRSDASRVVAPMKNPEPIRNDTEVDLPRFSVSQNFSVNFWKRKFPISITVEMTDPLPAIVGFVYELPESFKRITVAIYRAVNTLAATKVRLVLVDLFSASATFDEHSKIFLLSVTRGWRLLAAGPFLFSTMLQLHATPT